MNVTQGSSFLVCGPSNSGKTTLVSQILRNRQLLFDKQAPAVFLFYTQSQPCYDELLKEGIITKKFDGYPSYETVKKLAMPFKKLGGSIAIFDDQLSGLSNDIVRIFQELVHHANMTTFYLTQNLFHSDARHRSLSLNASYLILTKNPRDRSQIVHLAKQFSPYHASYLIHSYLEASKKMYGYLVLDCTQTCPDMIRVRSRIFLRDIPNDIYIEKS